MGLFRKDFQRNRIPGVSPNSSGHASCEQKLGRHAGCSNDDDEVFSVANGTEKWLETDVEYSFWISMERY